MISAVEFSELLMRYLFCKSHGEEPTYKKHYCAQLGHAWGNGDSTMELALLDAFRRTHPLPSPHPAQTSPAGEAPFITIEAPPTSGDEASTMILDRLALEQNSSKSLAAIEESDTPEGKDDFTRGATEMADPATLSVPGAYPIDRCPSFFIQKDEAGVASEEMVETTAEEAEAPPSGAPRPNVRRRLFRTFPESVSGTASDTYAGPPAVEAVLGCETHNVDASLNSLSICDDASDTRSREYSPQEAPETPNASDSSSTEGMFSTPGLISTPTQLARRNRRRLPAHQMMTTEEDILTSAKQLKQDYRKIHAILQGPKIKEAYIYILSAPKYFADRNHAPLVKIGYSFDSEVRVRNLWKKCLIPDLKRVYDERYAKHRYHEMVEKIVHLELKRFQRPLPCDHCQFPRNTNHKEWFDVPIEVALQTVQRWQRFVAQDPFDNDGKLRDVWDKALKDFIEKDKSEDFDDHDKRNDRWTQWLEKGIEAAANEAADA